MSDFKERPSFESFGSQSHQNGLIQRPKCLPECKNNGICVDTNTCNCPSDFHGTFCEFKKINCMTYPPMPANAMRKCNSEMCVITCMEGHKFIDGTSAANMVCAEGQWRPSRADLSSIPDCEPECDPPCLNGGVCISRNICQCAQEYKGAQCQYFASSCNNLIRSVFQSTSYKCSEDNEAAICKLSCGPGTRFSFSPAEQYTCLYSEGRFTPLPIPRCLSESGGEILTGPTIHYSTQMNRSMYEIHYSNESSHGSNSFEQGVELVIQDLTPKPGRCLSWAGTHYKSFDGKVYSFQSPCQHTLVRDGSPNMKFMVAVQHGDCKYKSYCPSIIHIYLEEKHYVLKAGENGEVIFRNSHRLIPIPASLPGIRVAMPRDVIVNIDPDLVLVWDTNNIIVIEASEALWNKTEGLCGTLDGHLENELRSKDGSVAITTAAFAYSWKVHEVGNLCEGNPQDIDVCAALSNQEKKKAKEFCTSIFSKDRFRKCSKVLDVSLLLEACEYDYCACSKTLNPEECACSTVSVYAVECFKHGHQDMRNWRDQDTCPVKCPEGKVYRACGPDTQPSCAFPDRVPNIDNTTCVEGCYCPEGLLLDEGKCVPKSECPCTSRNKKFKVGAVVHKDCNTCKCTGGTWSCSSTPCGARCGILGDPHYTTFDGKKFDFMGRCTYTVVQSDVFTLDIENIACSGSVDEGLLLSPASTTELPSCPKSLTLKYNGTTVYMKIGGFISVNGKEIKKLPVLVGDMMIRPASSLFVIVQLPEGVDIWFDGLSRIYVDVPADLSGKTKGLCGTFNLNQQDDFLTPEGDVEASSLLFGNKWKTRELCTDEILKETQQPCERNPQNKETAEKLCSVMKSKLFSECSWHVDVTSFYERCLYDVCACERDVSKCLCPTIGDYAHACAGAGVHVQWRYNVKECEISCTGGQQYTVCADSCLRTCADATLAGTRKCKPVCVEGCACANGQVLNDDNNCVPVASCPCFHKGLQFNPGYQEVRPGRKERELCTCVGARWECVPATQNDIAQFPSAEDLRHSCNVSLHHEFTTCLPAEPLTCKNMHVPGRNTVLGVCRAGCTCAAGRVLDAGSGDCVLPTHCPCHHAGRSYHDGENIQIHCNTCECKSGNWSCSDRPCVGVCTSWGDSHMITFDGSEYDFEGVCSYLLAKGCMEAGKDGFSVEIQNVPCGTTGATCSKSVTLRVGDGNNDEKVTLTADLPLPDFSKLQRIKLRLAGAYVFLDVPTLGISVQWDKATIVYVKADTMWKNRLKGLCGNYNSDSRDDFLKPGGGIAEPSALIFTDSWKLKSTCPKPEPVKEHCVQRPDRREWSKSKCSLLKSPPMSSCESVVDPDPFIRRCEEDACACDAGGDCLCVCAAFRAYADVCARRGAPVAWRTQDVCPMQCDGECFQYTACMSACPPETCDNVGEYSLMQTTCLKDTCLEGCKPKLTCPEGSVYQNSSLTSCIPRNKCRPVCMTLDSGRVVLEGEIIESDACHTCTCSKNQKICSGQPCTFESSTPPIQSGPSPLDEPLKCVPGWSVWINQNIPEYNNIGSTETEPLPNIKAFTTGTPMCKRTEMSKIECRTVGGHKEAKETGLAECSLETGLVCREEGQSCPDFEIRVFCQCEPETFQCTNATQPNHAHPTDCTKFYECTPDVGSPGTLHAVVKSCSDGLMYNPNTMVCDWPQTVIGLRPECGRNGEEIITIGKNQPTTSTSSSTQGSVTSTKLTTPIVVPLQMTTEPICSKGQEFSKCAISCDKLCHHFKKTLMDQGKCLPGQKCVEGCIDKSVLNMECGYGSMWRDSKTCVPIKDCTCYSNGDIVKPLGVTKDGCIKCQCIDNDLHCDSSDCISIFTPQSGSTHQPYIFTANHQTPEPIPTTIPDTTTSSTFSPTTIINTSESSESTEFSTTRTEPSLVPGDEAAMDKVISEKKITDETIILVNSTVSPPPACKENSFKNLLWDSPSQLPDTIFSASSVASDLFRPEYAVLNGHPKDVTAGSWNPDTHDQNQYIQVELPHPTPIYGVILQGSPLFDQYVTSFEVMYGDDGHKFAMVKDTGGDVKIFRGPTDKDKPSRHIFNPPIEAKFVRIHPLTWHEEIAIRFELIGCDEVATTTMQVFTTLAPTSPAIQCSDALGISAGLPIDNIEVSSEPDKRAYFDMGSDKGWTPSFSTPGEWILFDFTSPRIITGVATKGGPKGWVTSYNIMYTSDLTNFNPVVDDTGAIKAFPANYDHNSRVTNEFSPPIQARYLKVLPVKWNHGIEMRIEPIGCFRPYSQFQCLDSAHPNHAHPSDCTKFYECTPDIGSPGTLHAVVKSCSEGLMYNPNTMVCDWPQTVIGLRPECGKNLEESEKNNATVVHQNSAVNEQRQCRVCAGVEAQSECQCEVPMYFDGDECVEKDQCPCFVGHMSYSVGTKFRGVDCDECLCKIGGVLDCKPAKECSCQPDLVPKLLPSCECSCEPCPNGTKICPTSHFCLSLDKWCDGLQNCPDDERDCTTTTLKPTSTLGTTTTLATITEVPFISRTAVTLGVETTTEIGRTECQHMECPRSYVIHFATPKERQETAMKSDIPPPRQRQTYLKYIKGGKTGYTKGGSTKGGYGTKGRMNGGYKSSIPKWSETFTLAKPTERPASVISAESECAQFKCVPQLPKFNKNKDKDIVCSAPKCPSGYTLNLENRKNKDQCPQYTCLPPPELPAFCNITGRTINTFDGIEYKYDLCYHILARDNRLDAWTILVRKKCRIDNCTNQLLIRQDDELIIIRPDLIIEYDNYEYTIEQTSLICFQKNSFQVSRLGPGVLIRSSRYNYTVVFVDGDIKISVPKVLKGSVDGLCGYFDGDISNERRLPDGSIASSIDRFAKGWAKPGTEGQCTTKVVSPEKQKKIWDICSAIIETPLSECNHVLNSDKWRGICLEKMCECTEQGSRSEEQCKCAVLEQYVAECLAADATVDLTGWRINMGCPAFCPSPLVHVECHRGCPATCGVEVGCEAVPGLCTAGCYCPQGTLAKGSDCVTPDHCYDCTCKVSGTPTKYITFEQDDLPFDGNCTYLASRDTIQDGDHKYQVYVTNGICDELPTLTCTKLIHLIYNNKIVRVEKNPRDNKLQVSVDDPVIFKFPMKKDDVTISMINGQDISIKLEDAHVEITILESQLDLSIGIPSSIYAGRSEGLCGVCAGNQLNLLTSYGNYTDDLMEYGKSWRANTEVLSKLKLDDEKCGDIIEEKAECEPPTPENNPCYNLYNVEKFGPCHALEAPEPYVSSCTTSLCSNSSSFCTFLSQYAAACRSHRSCVNWRDEQLCPMQCESPLVYRPCIDCQETCDNYELLNKDKSKCGNKQLDEGCYCPEGKVRVNNTCIEPSKCFPCDSNKEHYAGDEWQEDACTRCTCSKSVQDNSAHVTCKKQTCVPPVCSEHEQLRESPTTPGQCCKKYDCVPKAQNLTCEEPKKIECGYGQVLKQKTTPNRCIEFTCECVPLSMCPSVAGPPPLLPGEVHRVHTGGCCPLSTVTCRPLSCPPPPTCHDYMELNTLPGKCCPNYTCEAPKDKCIVTLEWESSSKGGEQKRSPPETILKELESIWLDGPCRRCHCKWTLKGPEVVCDVTRCAPSPGPHYEPRPQPFQCCPQYEPVACWADGGIRKIGEKWQSDKDVCVSYECIKNDKEESETLTLVNSCDIKCQPGWKYFPSTDPTVCCGECQPISCVLDGVEYDTNQTWYSDDHCTSYSCDFNNGTLQVQSKNEVCRTISEADRKKYVYKDKKVAGQCCPVHKTVACLVGNVTYQEGETWRTSDPCRNMSCVKDSEGRLSHVEHVETCVTECQIGWEYKHEDPDTCCGGCVQASCVVDGELKAPGSTWSSGDNCTSYSCDGTSHGVVVSSSTVSCPDVSDCPPTDIYNDTCCPICKARPQALSTCRLEPIALNNSIGALKVKISSHGWCINKQPLKNIMKCSGFCASESTFDYTIGEKMSKCDCCQPYKYITITVPVKCEDGTEQYHKVTSPKRCNCSACSASEDTLIPPAQY